MKVQHKNLNICIPMSKMLAGQMGIIRDKESSFNNETVFKTETGEVVILDSHDFWNSKDAKRLDTPVELIPAGSEVILTPAV